MEIRKTEVNPCQAQKIKIKVFSLFGLFVYFHLFLFASLFSYFCIYVHFNLLSFLFILFYLH